MTITANRPTPFRTQRATMTRPTTRSDASPSGMPDPRAGYARPLLALGALLGLAGAAHADIADDGIQEIVVTAQRRAENSQDVPVAISAFSAADLQRAGVRQ